MSKPTLTAVICCALAFATCSSPIGPGECRNGVDDRGRGPVIFHTLQCTPVGSDVQCVTQRSEGGHCFDPTSRNVTASAEWISSNPGVARFTSPGFLRVFSAGQVEISSRVGPDGAVGDHAYVVGLGAVPERLSRLFVRVRDAATSGRLLNVRVEIQPTRGPSQSCETGVAEPCSFLIFVGPTRVSASLQGYESAEMTAPPPLPDEPFTQSATLDLRPMR
jgi:hypothetical protein